MKGEMSYDILFHGPCEPLFTIDASYLDSAVGTSSYNFALRHTDFADNYLHLYLYLQANPAPKQVYLYVTPESFDIRFNSFHTYRFAPYISDDTVASVIDEMDSSYSHYMRFPLMRFSFYNSYKTFDAIQGVKHYVKGKTDPYFKDGYIAHPDNQFHQRPDGYIAPEHLVYAANYDVTELSDSSLYYELYEERQSFRWELQREKYLRKIFALCARYKIQLLLYESPPYQPSVKDQPTREAFIAKTKAIAKEYGSKYIVMDQLEIGREKTNFVCPLILSMKGTKPFLKIFSDTIRANL